MVVLYIIVILVFGLYAYARYKHFAIIKAINKHARNVDFIPVLASGRTIKAFTIEKTSMIYASKTISVDFVSYILNKVYTLFRFKEMKVFELYGNYAKSLCYAELKNSVPGANYLLNVHESLKRISPRKINVFIYGNAIYRYQDTLPIFTMNVRKVGEIKPISKAPLFKMISNAFVQMIVVMVLIKIASVVISNYLVSNFSIEDERVLWSYVDNVAVGEHIGRVDLLKAESELQALLDSIPVEERGNKYKFFVHIYNDEGVNVSIYPAGHIVMTKGFIEKLKYKNQALFALAHMVAHYNNGDHIKAIRDKIINLKLIASLFGEGSTIGKLLVWRSDFDHNYNIQQEILADEIALNVLNKKFDRISGWDIFKEDFYKVTNAYIKLFNTHPFSFERNEAIDSYITKHGFKSGNEEPLDYIIENITEPNKIEVGELSINDKFMDLFTEYRTNMNKQYNNYQDFLRPFNNILSFNPNLTIAELIQKKKALDQASINIISYRTNFKNIIDQYDKLFSNLIEEQKDPGQKRLLNNIWQKEKNAVLSLVNFYIDRDRQILMTQTIIIQFLTSRFGSFTVTNKGIEFQTNKEKDDYKMLQKRIEEILKKAPPRNTLNNN
jgi:hypothetical protein